MESNKKLDELKNLEKNIAYLQNENRGLKKELGETVPALNREFNEARRKLQQLETENQNLKAESRKSKDEILEREKTISSLKSDFDALQTKMRNKENELGKILKRLEENDLQMKGLEQQNFTRKNELQELTLKLQKAKALAKSKEEEAAQKEKMIARLKSDLEEKGNQVLRLEADIRKLKLNLGEQEGLIRELNTRIEKATRENQQLKSKLDDADDSSRLNNQSHHEALSELERLKRQLQEKGRECENIRSDLKESKALVSELEDGYLNLKIEYQEIIKQRDLERNKVYDENQRLQFIAQDRLTEIEKKSWENEKLMLKIALAYLELGRLANMKDSISQHSQLHTPDSRYTSSRAGESVSQRFPKVFEPSRERKHSSQTSNQVSRPLNYSELI